MSTELNKELQNFLHGFGPYAMFMGASVHHRAPIFLSRNIVIPRSELPKAKVIERNGATHVDCGSDWGTWKIQNVDRMRIIALDHVAAWVTAEEWNAKESAKNAARNIRRDEVCEELGCPGLYPTLISTAPMKLAIDRIIDLEAAK